MPAGSTYLEQAEMSQQLKDGLPWNWQKGMYGHLCSLISGLENFNYEGSGMTF